MSSQENDLLLFERIKANDEKVFEYVYYKYSELLCRYAIGLTADQAASEDLVNDSFLELWEKRQGIEIKVSIKAYLLITVRNKAFNYLKRKKHETTFGFDQECQSLIEGDVNVQIEKFLQIEQIEIRLHNAIGHLSPQCQQIFRMSKFNQLSYKEISDQMNISVFTVKTHIARALKSLRQEFENVKLILFSIISKK
jgi:RNA polymerase sigma-70 factor (ECF subfamily)